MAIEPPIVISWLSSRFAAETNRCTSLDRKSRSSSDLCQVDRGYWKADLLRKHDYFLFVVIVNNIMKPDYSIYSW